MRQCETNSSDNAKDFRHQKKATRFLQNKRNKVETLKQQPFEGSLIIDSAAAMRVVPLKLRFPKSCGSDTEDGELYCDEKLVPCRHVPNHKFLNAIK